jgi:hypothetical protein
MSSMRPSVFHGGRVEGPDALEEKETLYVDL